MGKVTETQRLDFQEKVKTYKAKIDQLTEELKGINSQIASDGANQAVHRIMASRNILNQIALYCAMNEISFYSIEVKNTVYLEKARQLIYEVLTHIEKVVTNYVDVPFTDYEDRYPAIESISDEDRLGLVKELGVCVDRVCCDFGKNSKWRWSFVEVVGRAAVVAKNLLDLKRYQKLDDPREQGYHARKDHLRLVQEVLTEASNGYRDKFELGTKDVEDIKKAIDLQKALLRINTINQDVEKIENGKKQIEVWTSILEKHLSKLDAMKRGQGQVKK